MTNWNPSNAVFSIENVNKTECFKFMVNLIEIELTKNNWKSALLLEEDSHLVRWTAKQSLSLKMLDKFQRMIIATLMSISRKDEKSKKRALERAREEAASKITVLNLMPIEYADARNKILIKEKHIKYSLQLSFFYFLNQISEHQIKSCISCGKLTLATRKNRMLCSNKCKQRRFRVLKSDRSREIKKKYRDKEI